MTRAHRIVIATLSVVAVIVLPQWVYQHERTLTLHERQTSYDEVRRSTEAQRMENERLRERVEALSGDDRQEERAVMERMGWVRANELVVEFRSAADSER